MLMRLRLLTATRRLFLPTLCIFATSAIGAATQPAKPPPPRNFGQPPKNPTPGDRLLDAYFRERTAAITNASLADIQTAADWDAKKAEYRRELAEMLGLW